MRRKQKKRQLYRLLFLFLLCMTIGYAALISDLSINGIAEIANSSWDIHFENIQVKDGSITPDSAANIDTDTSVSYEVTLSQPGDFYEFNVDVVNEGTIDAMISTVSSKMNNVEITTLPAYLEYSVTYEDDIAIAPNQLLAAGTSETYKVRIAFKTDINPEDLPQTDETLDLLFTVTYVQADENAIPRPHLPIIKPFNGFHDRTAYRSYAYIEKIKIINLSDEINPPANAIDSWDIGVAQNGNVMAYITANADDNTMYDLTIQGDGALYANPNSSWLFAYITKVDSINNIDVLNTSKVTDMSNMFNFTGYSSTVFTLDLGNNFDTSNVTTMESMFAATGYSSTVFTLELGDKFDTSQVTTIEKMFSSTGYKSTVFTLDLGNKFDTSNVTNMYYVFAYTGYNSTVFTLDLGDKFNTSKVTSMSNMFNSTGYKSTVFTLDLGDKFDTSNVTSMQQMFNYTGYTSRVFTLDLGNHFDTSKVTNMSYMFSQAGYSSRVFTLELGSYFDTSNVTNMSIMFYRTGYASTVFNLDLGNKFDTSNVTNMSNMFYYTGYASTVFNLDLGNHFDTSKVTDMSSMFYCTGFINTSFTLDLGGKFDTSNVTNMSNMFYRTGFNSTVITLDLGDNFDTSKVTDMNYMFYQTGYSNTNFTLDLSTFDFTSVTNYSSIFYGWRSTQKIYVGNSTAQNWIITNSGNSNLTTSNVLIKT